MPPHGKEIVLNEIEMDIMRVFVKRKILTDAFVMDTLLQLYSKIAGNYVDYQKNNQLRDKEDRI